MLDKKYIISNQSQCSWSDNHSRAICCIFWDKWEHWTETIDRNPKLPKRQNTSNTENSATKYLYFYNKK